MDSNIIAYYRLCACLASRHPATIKELGQIFGTKKEIAMYTRGEDDQIVAAATFIGARESSASGSSARITVFTV